MRHIIVFMAATCMFICSCSTEPEIPISKTAQLKQRSDSYQILGGENYVVLLKQHGSPDDDIYILRNHQISHFSQTISVINITEMNEGWDVLQSNGNHLIFKLNNNSSANYYGYSLTIVSGPENYTRFYNDGIPKVNPDIEAVKCGCKTSNEVGKCDAGGTGATECSIETSGGAFGNDLTEKCQVKCGEGHYACCTK